MEPKPLILKSWLGGLDSNQDNQIQNLMYCQLYDLPAEGRQQKRPQARPASTLLADDAFVNRAKGLPKMSARFLRQT